MIVPDAPAVRRLCAAADLSLDGGVTRRPTAAVALSTVTTVVRNLPSPWGLCTLGATSDGRTVLVVTHRDPDCLWHETLDRIWCVPEAGATVFRGLRAWNEDPVTYPVPAAWDPPMA